MHRIVITFVAVFILNPAWAIEVGNGYQTTQPVDGTNPGMVDHWSMGWGASGITGWNFVGQVNGASGTYLGNGWVLTANHVGTGNFVLNNQTYDIITSSIHTIYDGSGNQVDLYLFQVHTTSEAGTVLTLPLLPLRPIDPVAFDYDVAGSSAVLIGYGGGQGETWGENVVTEINQAITPDGYGYVSNDFLTLTGEVTAENANGTKSQSITNTAQVVQYDSGGGDFIYGAGGQWELAGINEVSGTDDSGQALSGFVQLDTYAGQINAIVSPASDTPTLPTWGLYIMMALLVGVASQALKGGRSSGDRLP